MTVLQAVPDTFCLACHTKFEGDDFERSMALMSHRCEVKTHKQVASGDVYCGVPYKVGKDERRRSSYNWKKVTCLECLTYKTDGFKRRAFLDAYKKKSKRGPIGTPTAHPSLGASLTCDQCYVRVSLPNNSQMTAPAGWGVFTMLFKVQGSHRAHDIGGKTFKIASQGMGAKVKNNYVCPTCLAVPTFQDKCGIKQIVEEAHFEKP